MLFGTSTMDKVIIFIMGVCTATSSPLMAGNKLSLAEWGSYNHRNHKGPGTYAYGYDIEDPVTGNIQFKQEEKHSNGTVTGSYGYIEPNGNPRVLYYISDHNGYRVRIENVKDKDPDVSHFPQNVIKHDEFSRPLQTPTRFQLPPLKPQSMNVIHSDFGNDISVSVPATSPSFDQKKVPVQDPIAYYPTPLVYTVGSGTPILGYSSPSGFVRGNPSIIFKI